MAEMLRIPARELEGQWMGKLRSSGSYNALFPKVGGVSMEFTLIAPHKCHRERKKRGRWSVSGLIALLHRGEKESINTADVKCSVGGVHVTYSSQMEIGRTRSGVSVFVLVLPDIYFMDADHPPNKGAFTLVSTHTHTLHRYTQLSSR